MVDLRGSLRVNAGNMDPDDRIAIGVASPPCFLDRTPERIRDFFGPGVETIQTLVNPPGFAYELADLADAGADIIVQVGSPLAYVQASGHDAVAARCMDLEQSLGRPVIVAGMALAAALRHLGITRVAVAGTYFKRAWIEALARFLGETGVSVAHAESFADQGFCAEGGAEALGWEFAPAEVRQSLLRTVEASGPIEAMVMAGVPTDFGHHVHDFEAESGLPLVSAEGATFWRLCQLTKLAPTVGRHGVLIDGAAEASQV